MVDRYGYSRAGRVLDVSRSVPYYHSIKDDSMIEVALLRKAEEHPTEGFWKAYGRLRLEGHLWNHKRIFRVYQQLGLSLRKKTRKGISLNRQRSWCISAYKEFAAKAADIVGLYLDPPAKAIVLAVDEKPSIQVLERKTGYIQTHNGQIMRAYQRKPLNQNCILCEMIILLIY